MQHSSHYGYPRKMREDYFGANFLSEVSQISVGHLAIINHHIVNRESIFEHLLSHVRATNRFFMSPNNFSMAMCTCNGWNIL